MVVAFILKVVSGHIYAVPRSIINTYKWWNKELTLRYKLKC